MIWRTSRREFDFSKQGEIIGILNVTPDSFSDGGIYDSPDSAVTHALEMLEEGAAIIDVGGESTRPNAEFVPAEDEIKRTVPVVEQLRARSDCCISIDTSKASVAAAAIDAGADIVNDVTGLTGDPEMLSLLQKNSAGIVIMHMQGTPQTMQANPEYTDVVKDVADFFRQQFKRCLDCDIDAERIVFDPGIGFGKTVQHNLQLLKHLPKLRVHDRPLLLGVSRKSFIGRILGSDAIEDRAWPTAALTAQGRTSGAEIFRVHEVRNNFQAMRMIEAIKR